MVVRGGVGYSRSRVVVGFGPLWGEVCGLAGDMQHGEASGVVGEEKTLSRVAPPL